MKTADIRIECPKCDGTGKIPLSEELRETLNALKSRKEASAPDLYRKMPNAHLFTPTAINQRLEDLRTLGLVQRTRKGKVFVYFPCSP